MSIGLIGKKLGMTHVYDDDGRYIPVTVVEAGPCSVTQVKTLENDGYEAVQIGFGETRETRLTQAQLGHLGDNSPLRHLREFRTSGDAGVAVGDTVTAGVFEPGQNLSVTGTSKGKGFAGVMKRHGAPGSVGAGTTPGRVFKGTRMAGQMGNKRVTVKNVTVFRVLEERNVVLLKGPVPGNNGSIVLLNPGSN